MPSATVYVNGVVLPVDAEFSEHEALAIRADRVLGVGDPEAVIAAAGADAIIVDLDGRTVLPGFIEPHMHFALVAGLGHLPDVGPLKYPTFEGSLAALREAAAQADPDEWVTGRQFDPTLLEPSRDLTVRELDEISPDRPAYVLNASGHMAYVNSLTLRLAGIGASTPNPVGGRYGRFEDGAPNGVLYGVSAHLPVLMRNEGIAERMGAGFVEAGRGVGEHAATLESQLCAIRRRGCLLAPKSWIAIRRCTRKVA